MRSYKQSSVVKSFGQWVVTGYGLECSEQNYPIPKDRLGIHDEYPIDQHMLEKNWVDPIAFKKALVFARQYFLAKP